MKKGFIKNNNFTIHKTNRPRWSQFRCSQIFLNLAFLFFTLVFSSYAFSNLTVEQQTTLALLESEARIIFDDIPGFKKLLKSPNNRNYGRGLEIETGLYLQEKDFLMEHFGLDLQIYNGTKITCNIGGKSVSLRSGEFDILAKTAATNIVCECKSTKKFSSKKIKKMIKQFTKERNWLRLMKQLYQEYLTGKLSFKHSITKKGRFIIKIKSPSTQGKEIQLLSSWTTGENVRLNYNKWIKIITMLAHKKLKIFFKYKIPKEFGLELIKKNFDYEDNISYLDSKFNAEKNTPLYASIEKLTTEFSRLSLSSPRGPLCNIL